LSKKKSDSNQKGHGKNRTGVRQLSTIEFEDFTIADQVFLDHFQSGELMPHRSKEPSSSATERKVTSKSRPTSIDQTIDLHGLTLDAACRLVDQVIAAALDRRAGPVTFKIVTGRGIHSGPGGGVLVGGVHRYVSERYSQSILRIDSSPAETQIWGLPWRGFFTVTIRNK
jgi:DNA-nicking Smr family endonuclease